MKNLKLFLFVLLLQQTLPQTLPKKVVVIMFENHSFDTLLGYLWANATTGEMKNKTAYEGLQGQNFSNPIPPSVAAKVGRQQVWVYPGKYNDLAYLHEDPGEEYGYVNIELYNQIDPQNLAKKGPDMLPPYNVPTPLPSKMMQGFVSAFINILNATKSDLVEDYEAFSTIMSCLPNSEVPVLTTIAQNFAVFDHWFADVPSQTYPNRQFFVSATSGGKVINHIPSITEFSTANAQRTIFDQLTDNNKTWKVYYPQAVPFTLLLNYGSLKHQTKNFVNFENFFKDLSNQSLPDLSFLEPDMLGIPNDYHPSDSDNGITNHSSILAGEELLARIYNAIKNTPKSYREQILFVITFDESGGTFDHVAPPSATPPDNNGPGEMDFNFDRLGIRVPTIFINDYIQPGTTIQQELQHTSFMRFLRTLWNISENLTNRDKTAPDINLAAVFSNTPRVSWPNVTARNISNPGNATDDNQDDDYYGYVSVFEEYLSEFKCSVKAYFGSDCNLQSGASINVFSLGGLLSVLIISCMFVN